MRDVFGRAATLVLAVLAILVMNRIMRICTAVQPARQGGWRPLRGPGLT
ncbi:MAG: hypothetical protein OXH20_01045 [bacterium]|nr:hypothetical protein [bacterium]MDE0668030.1 hypothetical protein [bacterium]